MATVKELVYNAHEAEFLSDYFPKVLAQEILKVILVESKAIYQYPHRVILTRYGQIYYSQNSIQDMKLLPGVNGAKDIFFDKSLNKPYYLDAQGRVKNINGDTLTLLTGTISVCCTADRFYEVDNFGRIPSFSTPVTVQLLWIEGIFYGLTPEGETWSLTAFVSELVRDANTKKGKIVKDGQYDTFELHQYEVDNICYKFKITASASELVTAFAS